MRLTKRDVEAATWASVGPKRSDELSPTTPRVLWDRHGTGAGDPLAGFGVQVFPGGGTKTFILRFQMADGTRDRLKIGRFGPSLSVEKARKEAVEALTRARSGSNPARERATARLMPSMRDFCGWYLDVYCTGGSRHRRKPKKDSSRRNDRSMAAQYVVPAIGSRKVGAVTRADIEALLEPLSDRPYLANRVLSLVHRLFKLAELEGHRPQASNPSYGIARHEEQPRECLLSADELGRLGAALRDYEAATGDVYSAAAVRLLIFTGCRRGEILNLRWDEVDLERGLLRLRDSKSGRKVVVLPDAGLDVLATLARSGPHVIPGLDPQSPRADLNKPWQRIRTGAGLPALRLHDLRHLFASTGLDEGLDLAWIGSLLGHSQVATTARYAHLAATRRRAGANEIASALRMRMGAVVEAVEEPEEALEEPPAPEGVVH